MIKIKKVYVCRSDLEKGHDLSNTTQMSGVVLNISQRMVNGVNFNGFLKSKAKTGWNPIIVPKLGNKNNIFVINTQ